MRRVLSAVGVVLLSAQVTMAAPGKATLTWTDASDNETLFNVERAPGDCTTPGTFAEIATVGSDVTTFTDLTLKEGLTYCYRVAASNPAGKSTFSNTAAKAVPFTVPATPTGLLAK